MPETKSKSKLKTISAKEELHNLKSELTTVRSERNFLNEALKNIQERVKEEIDINLSRQATNYEAKLTELHSVIAELQKKLQAQNENVIREEEEGEDVETNDAGTNFEDEDEEEEVDGRIASDGKEEREESIFSYLPEEEEEEGLGIATKEAEKVQEEEAGGGVGEKNLKSSNTAEDSLPLLISEKEKRKEKGHKKTRKNKSENALGFGVEKATKEFEGEKESREKRKRPKKVDKVLEGENEEVEDECNEEEEEEEEKALKMNILYNELSRVREEHKEIRDTIASKDGELRKTKNSLQDIAKERDFLKNKVNELEMMLKNSPCKGSLVVGSGSNSPFASSSPVRKPKLCGTDKETENCSYDCKIAEKVKLPRSPFPSPKNRQRNNFGNMNLNALLNDHSSSNNNNNNNGISGADMVKLANSGSCLLTGRVAEHLVREIKKESNMREMESSFRSVTMASGVSSDIENSFDLGHEKIQEFEIELERLGSRVEYLNSENEVLFINLEEAKNNSHRLTILLGKYESNNLALSQCNNISDETIEAYDVLVALLESELGQLLANCRAAGFGSIGRLDEIDVANLVKRANENRITAELAAKSLLSRFYNAATAVETNCTTTESVNNNKDGLLSPAALNSQCKVTDKDKAWEDSSGTLSSSSSVGEGNGGRSGSSFETSVENQIRDLIIQLKGEHGQIGQTVMMELETVGIGISSISPAQSPCELVEARKCDLEIAILNQELMAMREEKAELRAQIFFLEKELRSTSLRLEGRESQMEAYKTTLQLLRCELQKMHVAQNSSNPPTINSTNTTTKTNTSPNKNTNNNINNNNINNRKNGNDISPDANANTIVMQSSENSDEEGFETASNANTNMTSSSLQVDSLTREKIEQLIVNLERVREFSERRERETGEITEELKCANGILIESLESAKKKYTKRLRKMEDQILSLIHKHSLEIKLFKDKVNLLQFELDEAKIAFKGSSCGSGSSGGICFPTRAPCNKNNNNNHHLASVVN